MVKVSVSTTKISFKDWHKSFKPPPSGLSPIGNGIYKSPDVVDPRDKRFYPDSPWNGGNPIDHKKFVGYDIDVSVDNCGATVDLGGTVGFLRMPHHVWSYRLPGECRNMPPDEPPRPAPPNFNPNFRPTPLEAPLLPNYLCLVLVGWHYYSYSAQYYSPTRYNPSGWAYAEGKDMATSGKIIHPSWKTCKYATYPEKVAIAEMLIGNSSTETSNSLWKKYINNPDHTTEYGPNSLLMHPDVLPVKGTNVKFISAGNFTLYYGMYAEIYPLINGLYFYQNIHDEPGTTGDVESMSAKQYEIFQIKIIENYAYYPPRDLINPYTPKKKDRKDDCCMQCCSSTEPKLNDTLLRQILAAVQKVSQKVEEIDREVDKVSQKVEEIDREVNKVSQKVEEIDKELDEVQTKLKKVSEIIGIDEFPVSMPGSIVQEYDEEGNKKTNNTSYSAKNLPYLINQYFLLFEEVIGELGIAIRLEDTDLTKEGNQTKTVVFHTLSDLIADLFGMAFDIHMHCQVLVNSVTRNLVETGSARQQTHINHYQLKALVDYMGFKVKESSKKIPFSFTPNAEQLEKFLEGTDQEVPIIELDQKRHHTDDMLELKHAAAITRAVYFKKVDLNGGLSVARQIADIIKNYKKNNEKAEKLGKGVNDLSSWLEQFELGFPNTPGSTVDSTKPWGKDFKVRPKVRLIGGTDSTNNTGK